MGVRIGKNPIRGRMGPSSTFTGGPEKPRAGNKKGKTRGVQKGKIEKEFFF
ncbi:hypothetical protein POX_g08969 [Penicillium oxalicum]|uniref:hypothetical protein n=1 Tax=Penicillium oxalicum TaxID=69781 RepID=UPI0020B8A974|nr:hypothetical protein POX_g08969 [Penicillium oxalicum]KAI2786582.1 hypothetical protein POX_g08969 [Penicillium oxalicum]